MIWDWSPWISFPTQGLNGLSFPAAPVGPGVYELRHRSSGHLILFGHSQTCAERMRSLAVAPWGVGTRNNTEKRQYVQQHYSDIEFRTIACASKHDAKKLKSELKLDRDAYIFPERKTFHPR